MLPFAEHMRRAAEGRAKARDSLRPNVRRAELVDAEAVGDRCDLRLVFRLAPMRVPVSREMARRLIEQLTPFANGSD